MTRRRGGKRWGTPTGEPKPQAIDPASGFKVDLDQLERQWDNQLIDKRFIDKRNPQDYLRGIKDDQSLPYSRPEPPDVYVAGPILWQDGLTFVIAQNGVDVLLTEGVDAIETL